MKKVFFIIFSYTMGGGAESLLTSIVNHLNPEKYEIGIMELVHGNVKVEPTNPNIKIYPYYLEANDPERKAKMYSVFHEWGKVIAEYIPRDYDLYVAFNYQRPSFLLPPGKKTIAWIHSDVYHLGQENLKEELALQDKAFYKTDRIVSISDITTESLEALFPQHKSRIRILLNGLDIEKVRRKAKEDTTVKLEHPALLYIGRLEERKDPLRLLNIFARVHKQEPKAHLYYLGYGGLSGAVRDSAEKLGLSDQVHLLGYHENPFPIMAQCDVVCMFSLIEGFPMVLLEGVALDKPFVSSVIGGSRILANGQKCGRTVETGEEAVDAIFDMLKADQEHIKSECRKSIKRFELKEYIRQIEELFDEVLEDEN